MVKQGELVRQGGRLVVNPVHTFYIQNFSVKCKAYYELRKSSYKANMSENQIPAGGERPEETAARREEQMPEN